MCCAGLKIGYRWYQTANVLPRFPFGFGLSYSTFNYSQLVHSTSEVRFLLTNSGSRAATEVAQLYLGLPEEYGAPPLSLQGFQKVDLQPGEARQVGFVPTETPLSVYRLGFLLTVTVLFLCRLVFC